jgi:hypothetical protein
MTGCPSDFQVGAHDAALTRPTERALRALAPSRAAVRPARAPTPIRARRRGTARARVVDVRRGGLGRIRRGSPDFPTVYFSPWVSSASARPRGAPAATRPHPRFGRQILKSFVRALHPHAATSRGGASTPANSAARRSRRSASLGSSRDRRTRVPRPLVASGGGGKRVRSLPRRVVLPSALADGSRQSLGAAPALRCVSSLALAVPPAFVGRFPPAPAPAPGPRPAISLRASPQPHSV